MEARLKIGILIAVVIVVCLIFLAMLVVYFTTKKKEAKPKSKTRDDPPLPISNTPYSETEISVIPNKTSIESIEPLVPDIPNLDRLRESNSGLLSHKSIHAEWPKCKTVTETNLAPLYHK